MRSSYWEPVGRMLNLVTSFFGRHVTGRVNDIGPYRGRAFSILSCSGRRRDSSSSLLDVRNRWKLQYFSVLCRISTFPVRWKLYCSIVSTRLVFLMLQSFICLQLFYRQLDAAKWFRYIIRFCGHVSRLTTFALVSVVLRCCGRINTSSEEVGLDEVDNTRFTQLL